MTDVLDREAVDGFVDYLAKMNKSDHTIRSYETGLTQFVEHVEGSITHASIADEVSDWLATLSSPTAKNRLAAIRLYWKWQTDGQLLLPGFTALPSKEAHHAPLPAGMDDVARMVDGAETPQLRLIVALCGTMGLRISEARKLQAAQVDLEKRVVEVFGKGAKWRTVPIPTRSYDIIAAAVLAAPSGRLAPDYGDSKARADITKLAKTVDVGRHVSSHDLRATFIRNVWDNTQNQEVAMQLAGHTSWEITLRYLGVDNTAHRKAVE